MKKFLSLLLSVMMLVSILPVGTADTGHDDHDHTAEGALFSVNAECQHTNMSDWNGCSKEQHYRYCLDCQSADSMVYTLHRGGKATCIKQAICEDCQLTYGPCDDNYHANIIISRQNAEQHIYVCDDCWSVSTIVPEDHYGNDGDPYCDGCGETVPELCHHTNITFWYFGNEQQHWGSCEDCYASVYADHEWGEWEWQSYSFHCRQCIVCDRWQEEIPHYAGENICLTDCEGCGGIYEVENGAHCIDTWSYWDT